MFQRNVKAFSEVFFSEEMLIRAALPRIALVCPWHKEEEARGI